MVEEKSGWTSDEGTKNPYRSFHLKAPDNFNQFLLEDNASYSCYNIDKHMEMKARNDESFLEFLKKDFEEAFSQNGE